MGVSWFCTVPEVRANETDISGKPAFLKPCLQNVNIITLPYIFKSACTVHKFQENNEHVCTAMKF